MIRLSLIDYLAKIINFSGLLLLIGYLLNYHDWKISLYILIYEPVCGIL